MIALGIVVLALAILISVLLHEAGHMMVAKSFGMKVTRYFVGFGNTLWSFRRGETEYGIKSIPAGGFVNIVGQVSLDDVDPADYPRAMVNKPAYQRFLVLLAGSVTHFLLALIIFAITFLFYAQPNGHAQIDSVSSCTNSTCTNAPAHGVLRAGDEIIAVNGKELTNAQDELPGRVQNSGGKPVTFTIKRDGHQLTKTIKPHNNHGSWVVGVEVGSASSRLSAGHAITHAGSTFGEVVKGTFAAFGHLPGNVAQVFHHQSKQQADNPDRLVSVVGVSQLGGEAFSAGGVQPLLLIIASVNISFGIFNLLPLLPLDGGHIAIVLYDKFRSVIASIRRRRQPAPTDYEKLVPVTLFFAALIAIVAVAALLNDIIHPVGLPS